MDKEQLEDIGLNLGIKDFPDALERAIEELWEPFWKHLPPALCTPRTLISNRGILHALLERAGCSLVAEQSSLRQELLHAKEEIACLRRERSEFLARLLPMAQSSKAWNLHGSREEESLDLPFPDLQEQGNETFADPIWGACEPWWKIAMTLSREDKHCKVVDFMDHRDFVELMAGRIEIVSEDPAPESMPLDLGGLFGGFSQ